MTSRSTPLALALAALALGACDAGAPQADAGPTELERARERRAEGGDAPAPRPIDPASTGALRGTVSFAGAPPERREIPLIPECRHDDGPLLDDAVVVGPDGGLADVLVHVRGGLAGWEIPAAEDPGALLDQRGCAYRPHVLALRAGGTLRVANSDPLTHNVRVRARRNGVNANRTQSAGADPIAIELPRPELGIQVGCDLHPWMGAVVHVLDHPFFAVTDEDGAFAIEGLPAGSYELEARHPELGRRRRTVTVAAGETRSADFELAEE